MSAPLRCPRCGNERRFDIVHFPEKVIQRVEQRRGPRPVPGGGWQIRPALRPQGIAVAGSRGAPMVVCCRCKGRVPGPAPEVHPFTDEAPEYTPHPDPADHFRPSPAYPSPQGGGGKSLLPRGLGREARR